MLPNYHKEKTYHAITYFTEHTANCYKKKLFKLLFLLDFDYYEQIGREVTDLDYFAWKMGPVPTALFEAITTHDAELIERFEIVEEDVAGYEATKLLSRVPFEPKFFSEAELDLMKEISRNWYEATAKELEEFTHRTGGPWDMVWNEENRPQGLIPIEYALMYLDEDKRKVIQSIAKEDAAVLG